MYFLFWNKLFCTQYIFIQNEALFLKIGSCITKYVTGIALLLLKWPSYNRLITLALDDTLLYYDILLYLTIHNSSDYVKLQEDLNNLERWESDWQMSFHPEKCEVIHILTTKKTPILHSYSLHGQTLPSVPQIKYLGVHISQNLKWNSHINSTSSKANQTLGFLKRNSRINSSTVKEKAYKSLVCQN